MQAALHEGVALALLGMKESYVAADTKGSLTSEDLVASLSAVLCDFNASLPFFSAAELASAETGAVKTKAAGADTSKRGAGTASKGEIRASDSSMTAGQRVFYDKILKPRKPGAWRHLA